MGFYRVKISIALAIHSLDPIRSLDHSLSARLIPAYGFVLVRLSVQSNRCTFVQSRANQNRKRFEPISDKPRVYYDARNRLKSPPLFLGVS